MTTTDSVAPAKQPVRMAIACVFFRCPLLVKKAPQDPLAATAQTSAHIGNRMRTEGNIHLTARLGASSMRGGKMPLYKRLGLKLPCCEHRKKTDELTPPVRRCS